MLLCADLLQELTSQLSLLVNAQACVVRDACKLLIAMGVDIMTIRAYGDPSLCRTQHWLGLGVSASIVTCSERSMLVFASTGSNNNWTYQGQLSWRSWPGSPKMTASHSHHRISRLSLQRSLPILSHIVGQIVLRQRY